MLVVGDCRDTLARWAADGVRVQTVVTSPPYWGLRDYGLPALVWGGDAVCAHEWRVDVVTSDMRTQGPAGPIFHGGNGHTHQWASERAFCLHCSAWRGSLGLEPTPELYVQHLVDVFRLVRDVLADDGTCWINLGDSYNAGTAVPSQPSATADVGGWTTRSGNAAGTRRIDASGLKPKDLVGIPWRVAFALQADGWYLRSDIIWAKPNPMPESVTDRPTKAHEYLFLLAKSSTYYYDAAAIREPHSYAAEVRVMTPKNVNGLGLKPTRPYGFPLESNGRNRRSVWTIATQPYPEAHFATMPEALVKPCILAGSRPGDTVLDPFMGSGTVAKVAQDLGRAWLGCELNPQYADLCRERTRQEGLVL